MNRQRQPEQSDRPGNKPAQPDPQPDEGGVLVVIGSSAGGIEALTDLLGPLDPAFKAPIVVAQHTQPTRVSRLAEVLSTRTRLNVVTVDGTEPLKPATVYVVQADHHVIITDHVVESRPATGQHPSPSVDRLLASASEVFGDRLIAVILSGMGSDGVLGAGEVKARGGTVVIQNPETAAQPAMPRSLPPNIVDFVADADRIGELLAELVTTPAALSLEDDDRLMTQFLERVRERTGIDFSAYKRPTVARRLHRRMVATASPRLRDYVRYVQKHPEEYGRLASSFLIKVTQFFRDTDLFDHLRTVLLPALVTEARQHGHELRIWSAGCATGEEAYSVAVLVAEALGREIGTFTVRVFATDLDEDAINFARHGVYPASAMAGVPQELLDRYFNQLDDHYEVTKEIRSLVVLGEHDLGQRAPFPRIDLALCRNVLIYFTPELQKRALQLFAFSLREGGYLVLGKAESSTPYAEHFILEQPRLKIYRRAGDRVLIPPARIRDSAPVLAARSQPRRDVLWPSVSGHARNREPRQLGERLDEVLLRLPIGVVVIDAHYDISFLNAAARRMLRIHGTAVGNDFIHLAHQLPSEELRAAVNAAVSGEARVVTRPLAVESDDGGETTHIQLTLQPYREAATQPVTLVIITAADVSETVREHATLDVARLREDRANVEDRLERVGRTNRELLQANEEMTNANAVLRTMNEELQVANEEVQAATEEVETLNEELQATNEELETLNEELQATVEELNTTNDDLESRSTELADTAASLAEQRQRSETERERLALILDGMSEAVLVVGPSGGILSTNRAYDQEFGAQGGLAPEDAEGSRLAPEEWPQERAARGETFSMSFTRADPSSGSRRWYEAAGHGSEGGGGIVVIRDITDRSLRHLQERFIDTASHELKTPVVAMNHYLRLVERGAKNLEPGVRAYLDGAIREASQLAELASRLFDVSLVRHGRLVIRRDPVDLAALAQEVVDETLVATPDAKVMVRTVPAVVDGDALRLAQLLRNLIRNALVHGASDEGVEVVVERGRGEATVSVADRGPGVAAAVRSQLFAPFVSSTIAGGEGLGLGLYVARAIAEGHHGHLDVGPRDGGGTMATLTLPLAGAVQAAKDAPS